MKNKKNVHVIVATGEWDQDHLRYRRHRFAEYLASHPETEEVIWVCPSPNGDKESFSTLKNGIIQFIIKDIHPNKLFRFGRYFDLFYKSKLIELQGHLKEKEKRANLYLWYTFPGFSALTGLVEWEKTTYDCSDLWASSVSGNKNIILRLREKSILQSEQKIVQHVDTIVCTSDFLYEYLKDKYNPSKDIHVLENGVEFELFQEDNKSAEVNISGDLVLGFIGGIKPKLDFAMLIRMMNEKRNWHLLLVGPDGTNQHPEFKKLLQLENVTWTGKVPPMEVPKYMKLIDIGILPYRASIYNNAVFPLKLFEFLGAGKPVVGMNLPSTEKFSEPNIYEYARNDDYLTFMELCQSLSADLNDEEFITIRKNLAKEKDWNNIFTDMYSIAIKDHHS